MKRLKILNVAYPFAAVTPETAGGAEQVLAMIDEAIVAAGHESLVLAAPGSQTHGQLVASAPVPEILDISARRHHLSIFKEQLEAVLRSGRVDVVHFHGLDFAVYLPTMPATYMATIHLPPEWYPRRSFEQGVHVVWVSRNQREASAQADGNLIPNGVRIDRLYPEGVRENYVLAMGRICPEKAQHLALDAATHCGRPLLLAGQVFPYPEHLEYFDLQIKPRLASDHSLIGPVAGTRKRHLLARAHCVVIASQVPETSSLVAMEALACGTPVVALRVGALPEIIENGRTGWLVESPGELPAAIEAASHIRREDCRRVAEQRFSAERMTRAYLEMYEQLTFRNTEYSQHPALQATHRAHPNPRGF